MAAEARRNGRPSGRTAAAVGPPASDGRPIPAMTGAEVTIDGGLLAGAATVTTPDAEPR